MKNVTFRPSLLCAALCLSLVSRPAPAQELDDQTRSAARELATEGSQLYGQNDFEGAYDRFSRAYQLVRMPNVGIWAARSLVRAGRWVEASERYLELVRSALPEGAPEEQLRAKADASQERDQVLARMPSVRVLVEGVAATSVFVSLNGQLVQPALIGAKQPVNPGKLLVKGVRGDKVVEVSIELPEGQFREVRLVFPAGGEATTPKPVTAAPAPSPGRDERGTPSGSALRTLGFVSLGVGGGALVTGAVFGLLALGDKTDLEGPCQAGCPPHLHDANNAYGTKRIVSSVGLVAGTILTATGAVLVFAVAPSSSRATEAAGPAVRGFVSLGRAGVTGEF